MKFPTPDITDPANYVPVVSLGDQHMAEAEGLVVQHKQTGIVTAFLRGNALATMADLMQACVECPSCLLWVDVPRLFRQGDCPYCERCLVDKTFQRVIRGVKRMNSPLSLFEILAHEPYPSHPGRTNEIH